MDGWSFVWIAAEQGPQLSHPLKAMMLISLFPSTSKPTSTPQHPARLESLLRLSQLLRDGTKAHGEGYLQVRLRLQHHSQESPQHQLHMLECQLHLWLLWKRKNPIKRDPCEAGKTLEECSLAGKKDAMHAFFKLVLKDKKPGFLGVPDQFPL